MYNLRQVRRYTDQDTFNKIIQREIDQLEFSCGSLHNFVELACANMHAVRHTQPGSGSARGAEASAPNSRLQEVPRPQSAEPSVRATSLQNPWQPWPMSMRNLHITRISKPQACRRWTDKHPGTQCRKAGKPGSAPCKHQASQVEQSFMQLASEVAKTHEGYHLDTDRNLRQGPQHTSRSSEVYVFHPMPVCLDTVMLQLHSTQRLRLTSYGPYAKAVLPVCPVHSRAIAHMGLHKGPPFIARYRNVTEWKRRTHQAAEDRCPCLQYLSLSASPVGRCNSPAALRHCTAC